MNIQQHHSFKSVHNLGRGGRPGSRRRLDLQQYRAETFEAQQWGLDDGDFASRIARLKANRRKGLPERPSPPLDITRCGDVESNPGPPRDPKEPRKSHGGNNAMMASLVSQAKDASDRAAGLEMALADRKAQMVEAVMIADHYKAALRTLQIMIEGDAQLDRVAAFVNEIIKEEKELDVPTEIQFEASKRMTAEKPKEEEPKKEKEEKPDHHEVVKEELSKPRSAHHYTPAPESRWRWNATLCGLITLVFYWVYFMWLAPSSDLNFDVNLYFVRVSVFNPVAYFGNYVVHTTCLMLMGSLVISLLGTTRKFKHLYETRLTNSDKCIDLRSDAMSLGKLLHDRIYTAVCTYTRTEVSVYDNVHDTLLSGWIGINTVDACANRLQKWADSASRVGDVSTRMRMLPFAERLANPYTSSLEWFMLFGLHYVWVQYAWIALKPAARLLSLCAKIAHGEVVALHRMVPAVKHLIVSLELLAQLTTPDVLKRGAKPEWVTRRIQEKAQALHSVAIKRYGEYEGVYIFQNTMALAYAIWADMERESEMVPFPTTPVA